MINCLRNYIDVWDRCSEKSANKLYVNDLPGFSLNIGNSITNEENTDALSLLRKKIDFACEKAESDIRNYLANKVFVNTIINQQTIGIISDNLIQRAAVANTMAGIRVDLMDSPYLSMFVNSFQYFPQTDATIDVEVYNVITGELIETFADWDVIGGQINTLSVQTEYKSNGQPLDLVFVVASAAVYDVQLWGGPCGSCRSRSYYGRLNNFAFADQIFFTVGQQPILNNLQSGASTQGLAVNYSLLCDNTDFICSLAPRLKLSMWYAAGIQILEEILFSKRLNTITTIDRARAKELKDEFEAQYQLNLGTVLDNMILPRNPCFQCNPSITRRNQIP